jgi:callose synthase
MVSHITGFYLADEWANFLERIGRGESSEDDFKDSPSDTLELRFWVSYRGQTLARTGQFVFFFISFGYSKC